ncbi:MAG TPA: hypothetical protein VHZ30_01410, partial [Verrucomicrobiae bacterium]|nr:hypothetical protein [Verrucomicrobiae bacterium]
MIAMIQPSAASAIPPMRNSSKVDGSDLTIESESNDGSSTAPSKKAVRFASIAPVEERSLEEESPQESSSDIVSHKSAPETNSGTIGKSPGATIPIDGAHKSTIDTGGFRSMPPVSPASVQKRISPQAESLVSDSVAMPEGNQSAAMRANALVSRPLYFASARESVLTEWPSPQNPPQTDVRSDTPAFAKEALPAEIQNNVPQRLQAKDILAALAADDGFSARVSNAAIHSRQPASHSEKSGKAEASQQVSPSGDSSTPVLSDQLANSELSGNPQAPNSVETPGPQAKAPPPSPDKGDKIGISQAKPAIRAGIAASGRLVNAPLPNPSPPGNSLDIEAQNVDLQTV